MAIKSFQNVTIKKIDSNNNVEEYRSSNHITKFMMSNIIKALAGQNYACPKYLAVGTGTSVVTINDTGLADETELIPRLVLSEATITSNPTGYTLICVARIFQKVALSNITEAGLFSADSGENCLARVLLDQPITKAPADIIEIEWKLTVTDGNVN